MELLIGDPRRHYRPGGCAAARERQVQPVEGDHNLLGNGATRLGLTDA